jgi:Gluconate 2-dehydrogenase subunit 3
LQIFGGQGDKILQRTVSGPVPLWFTEVEHRTLAAALDAVIPADDLSPGAGQAGGADYVDLLLGAFSFHPPRIWAGGPFSGRHGGDASFDDWLELGRIEELAWRMRIEGSQGRPEREFNGPVAGWQEQYRSGLANLGPDFADVDRSEQEARLRSRVDDAFRDLLFTHACESLYGDPVYGGNRDGTAWAAIGFDGDVQPRGWTDTEVAKP